MSSPLPILSMPNINNQSPTLSALVVAPVAARPVAVPMGMTAAGPPGSYFLHQSIASRTTNSPSPDQTKRWKQQQQEEQREEHKASTATPGRSTGAVFPSPLASPSPENQTVNGASRLAPFFSSSSASFTSSCTTTGTTMSSSRSSVSSSFGTTSNANNNSSSSSSSNQALSHTTTSTTISTASTMLDGGPPPWDLVAALLPAPGLLYYEHCRVAASIYAETARRMVTTGQLQHVKTLAILRTWDLYNYRCGFDITCGASDMIFRCLAMLGVQVDENGSIVSSSSGSGSSSSSSSSVTTGSVLGPQLPVGRNEELLTMEKEKALSPVCMPSYVARLRDGDGAVAGFVYCSGEFRFWTCDSFASKFFSAKAANKRFEEMQILPCYLFGTFFSPEHRPLFYRNLMEYLLRPTDETKEMSMTAEIMEHDGRICSCYVRARYMVLNEGQYACFALSFLPFPGMPSRFGVPAPFTFLTSSFSSSSVSTLASTNGFVPSPPPPASPALPPASSSSFSSLHPPQHQHQHQQHQHQRQHQSHGLTVDAGTQHVGEGRNEEAKEGGMKKRARVEGKKGGRARQWQADQEEQRRFRQQQEEEQQQQQQQQQQQRYQDEDQVEGERDDDDEEQQQQQHDEGSVAKGFDPRVPPLRQQQQQQQQQDEEEEEGEVVEEVEEDFWGKRSDKEARYGLQQYQQLQQDQQQHLHQYHHQQFRYHPHQQQQEQQQQHYDLPQQQYQQHPQQQQQQHREHQHQQYSNYNTHI